MKDTFVYIVTPMLPELTSMQCTQMAVPIAKWHGQDAGTVEDDLDTYL